MRLRFASLLSFAVVALATGACSNLGEGGVCNVYAGNMGNDDCQSGLQCTPRGIYGSRCCPVDLSQATTTVCSNTSAGVDANPAPPAEGEDAAVDATVKEAGTTNTEAAANDAPAETGADAPAPSAGEGGVSEAAAAADSGEGGGASTSESGAGVDASDGALE